MEGSDFSKKEFEKWVVVDFEEEMGVREMKEEDEEGNGEQIPVISEDDDSDAVPANALSPSSAPPSPSPTPPPHLPPACEKDLLIPCSNDTKEKESTSSTSSSEFFPAAHGSSDAGAEPGIEKTTPTPHPSKLTICDAVDASSEEPVPPAEDVPVPVPCIETSTTASNNNENRACASDPVAPPGGSDGRKSTQDDKDRVDSVTIEDDVSISAAVHRSESTPSAEKARRRSRGNNSCGEKDDGVVWIEMNDLSCQGPANDNAGATASDHGGSRCGKSPVAKPCVSKVTLTPGIPASESVSAARVQSPHPSRTSADEDGDDSSCKIKTKAKINTKIKTKTKAKTKTNTKAKAKTKTKSEIKSESDTTIPRAHEPVKPARQQCGKERAPPGSAPRCRSPRPKGHAAAHAAAVAVLLMTFAVVAAIAASVVTATAVATAPETRQIPAPAAKQATRGMGIVAGPSPTRSDGKDRPRVSHSSDKAVSGVPAVTTAVLSLRRDPAWPAVPDSVAAFGWIAENRDAAVDNNCTRLCRARESGPVSAVGNMTLVLKRVRCVPAAHVIFGKRSAPADALDIAAWGVPAMIPLCDEILGRVVTGGNGVREVLAAEVSWPPQLAASA